MSSGARQWRDELAAWTIDPEILAAAPESPYGYPPELFRAAGRSTPSPLQQLAREALPAAGGTVLDVGCGGGAASLPLAPLLHSATAVDEQPDMLDSYARAAAERDVTVTPVRGRWPDVADEVASADVVVCAHVLYNVPELGDFAAALTSHARRRVVVDLTAEHPWVDLGPLWQLVHHQPRPAGPTARLAERVLTEAGIAAGVRAWERPGPVLDGELLTAYVDFTRRRLCLPRDLDPVTAALVATHRPRRRRGVTLWWDV